MRFKLAKGLDVPVAGEPEQTIAGSLQPTSVGVVGTDYPGLSASLAVGEGERVRLGQTLFEDRRNPGVKFTSPGAGVVAAIHRGARRALQSVVVALEGDEVESLPTPPSGDVAALSDAQVRETLVASGAWTAFRARPYGRIPPPESAAHAIFVTAIDTNPLAPAPEIVVAAEHEAFADGLLAISRLTAGEVFVCCDPAADIAGCSATNVRTASFAGPHPAGLVGTHIHFLAPVSATRTVWYLGYQDVIAIGKLLRTGRPAVDRVVAVAGPAVRHPRLVRTRVGANLDEILEGELHPGPCRPISGSVLSGRTARPPVSFLGRYHNQVSVLVEERYEKAVAAGAPSEAAYSFYRGLWPVRRRGARALTTTTLHGRTHSMVPVQAFERVMPLEVLPVPLLRALLVGDTEAAEALGCLELEEEDLALCTFVCPAKHEYGSLLRSALTAIERRA